MDYKTETSTCENRWSAI